MLLMVMKSNIEKDMILSGVDDFVGAIFCYCKMMLMRNVDKVAKIYRSEQRQKTCLKRKSSMIS